MGKEPNPHLAEPDVPSTEPEPEPDTDVDVEEVTPHLAEPESE